MLAGLSGGVVIGLLLRTFVFGVFAVSGASMQSTLFDGDVMVVDKVSYLLSEPSRGDVVVLHGVEGVSSPDLVKRVAGLPGDLVETSGCGVLVNGVPFVSREGVVLPYGPACEPFAPVVVPSGHVFVVGDNNALSMDSRTFGPVPFDKVVGKAVFVAWPVGHADML